MGDNYRSLNASERESKKKKTPPTSTLNCIMPYTNNNVTTTGCWERFYVRPEKTTWSKILFFHRISQSEAIFSYTHLFPSIWFVNLASLSQRSCLVDSLFFSLILFSSHFLTKGYSRIESPPIRLQAPHIRRTAVKSPVMSRIQPGTESNGYLYWCWVLS